MGELSPRQRALKEEFMRARGYWSPTWDQVLAPAPNTAGISYRVPRSQGRGEAGPDSRSAAAVCAPLPPPSGLVIDVATVSELQTAVSNAVPYTTIRLAKGVYELNGAYLRLDTPHLTLRSASGNRDSVVLDGDYVTTEIIQIVASNVTVADLTLREARYHPIHVMSTAASDTLQTFIYNVVIIDPGQQAIKINPVAGGHFADEGSQRL